MSRLDFNLNDVPDLVNATPGEHDLAIESVEVKDRNNSPGNLVIHLRLKVVDEENTFPIYHYLCLPDGSDNDDNFLRSLKAFCIAFNTPLENPDPDDWNGLTGRALTFVAIDDTYGDRASVKKFIV